MPTSIKYALETLFLICQHLVHSCLVGVQIGIGAFIGVFLCHLFWFTAVPNKIKIGTDGCPR